MTALQRPGLTPKHATENIRSPLEAFLAARHASLQGDDGGAVADYIPELGKANPQHFGIALATTDGHGRRIRSFPQSSPGRS